MRGVPALATPFLLLALLVPLTACSNPEPAEVSERERLEAIGGSGLPGAQGVNRALDASDAMNARAEAHDTIGR